MSLKNNLKRGQVSLEYFILFSVIIFLTLSLLRTSFFSNTKATGERVFQSLAGRILK